MTAATGQCTWNTGTVATASYFIFLSITDGVNTNGSYSKYPIQVDPAGGVKPRMVLDRALLNFGGCAVVITHDRWFLDRIATHILAFEGDSKVVWCEGNYQAYEAQRRQRLGADADQPHRIKYRKLTH